MKRFVATILCGISFMLSSTWPAALADAFDFYARGPYRPSVPRPSQLLGYEPGEFHTDFRGMERVIFAIAQAASDRVRVIEYGQSYERRPLRLLLISAPENMNRLEEIRARVQKLADPRRLSSPEEAAAIIRTTPVVVWLNYANDGNESAAFEAALQVAYHFAASEEPKTRTLLENALIIINPAHNPESHERFVAWYNAFAVGAEDRFAYEHNAPWGLSTNNNHYQIDLNRDALASTQIETQALMRAYLQWNPQVFVDHHGQTTNFFFPPPAAPVNANLPKAYHEWMEIFGRGNAEAFDRQGWAYFVRDVFDLFYPGYWDSWPSLNGAIGMTYETDGGGSLGLRWRREDGALVTLRDGIAKHFLASLATVETAVRYRERLLQYFYDFKRTAIEEGARGPMRRFVLLPGNDPGRAAELVATLLRAGIEVHVAQEAFSSRAARDYLTKTTTARSFPVGAFLVDLAQPQMRLAKTLLEPEAELDPQFVKRQLEIRERNERRGKNVPKERYEFYDVTAWSLPLAFGVEAYWTEDAPRVRSALLTLDDAGRVVTSDDRKPIVTGGVTGRATSAYVFSYETNAAARLAFALLNEGYKIAVSTKPLRVDGRDFPRGTLVVPIERNPESVHERIATLAREYGVNVYAAASAYADRGDTGIGSPAVIPLRKPKIIVIVGDGVSVTNFGAIWFLFERRFGIPFTPMTLASLQRAHIFEYDVILFPDGNPSVYRTILGDRGIDRLKRWVNEGGVLIGIGGAAELFTQKGIELTTSRVLGAEEEALPSPGASAPSPASAQTPADKSARPLPVPGAILRATVDRHHFLTFGYDAEHLPVLVNGARFFTRSRDGANVVTFEGKELHLSGFIWPNNTVELLSGTAYLIHEPTGRGHVILYAQDPNFRLFWHSLTRLFLNSVLFAPSLR
ncbi:MAG: M14 family zinc carboxypeptidase [Blastocatellia bacterium]|nr:M14 family zinc carboxypeptidase [Blastocatellia bacterium]MCS7157720.1 M14 family zinc carboxypeptidase [Blastocatellia bacterium]MCX7751985.1 M14 family zinc carboxypeptidase [Blastocatellia bacterium]MDW8167091.1 M14 family zinc carboxypeptidase [Acidobacteriota bacterium]MDW8257195.1 M14 family zinc carboxypeptidase [Acidobacteriota bacterium]